MGKITKNVSNREKRTDSKSTMQKQMIHGSGISVISRVVQIAIQFITAVIIVKIVLPEDFGLYKWIVALSLYGALVASLGMDEIVAKYSVNFSELDDLSRKIRLLRDAYIIRNVACVITFIVLYLLILPYIIKSSSFSEMADLGIKIGILFGISSIFSSNIELSVRLLDAEFLFVKARLINFMNAIVPSILKVFLTYTHGIYGLAVGTLAGTFVTFMATEYITRRDVFGKYKNISPYKERLMKRILSESMILFVVLLISLSMLNLDLILVGFLALPKDVGYYSFAKMMVTILITILTFAAPMIYPYLIKKQIENNEVYSIRKILKFTFMVNFFVFGAVIVMGKTLTHWIFPNYLSGYPILLVLIGLLFTVPLSYYIVGPIINQHRFYAWQAKVMGIMLLPLIILNYLFILKLGVIGAAIATVLCVSIQQIIVVKKALQLADVRFLPQYIWKPFFAMIIPTIICYSSNSLFPWYFTLLSGVLFYPLLYLVIFSKGLSGFDDDDRRLIGELSSNLPSSIRKVLLLFRPILKAIT